ncbi:hypothetical protein [Raoultella terrigena]|jgi:hypothetical protein|uniref:hypothetical protein n=1 Tax=Raoultella terrigena TaxID=577 RepID=UPI003850E658
MVGLGIWQIKEYLTVHKSKMEYKMLFSHPEGKVVSRLGVLISEKESFWRKFQQLIPFYADANAFFSKGWLKKT